MIANIQHLIQHRHWPKWIEIKRRSFKRMPTGKGGFTRVRTNRKCAVCSQEARRGR